MPAGIEALELDGEPQQVVFLIQEHATLVTGDVLTGRDGVIHVFVDEAHREPLLASLERIAELPIEWVIVPHCESPIFVDGAARIRAAVTIPERRAIRSSRRRNVSYNRCEPMPRNIVTLAPRRLVLPVQRNRAARQRIERALVEKYRARRESDPERIVIDFPKRASRRAAKEEVAAALDQVERRWRRLYVLYPSESSLRERGE